MHQSPFGYTTFDERIFDFGLKPHEFHVYIHLLNFDQHSKIFPSLKDISIASKISIPTIRKSIKGLVEKGLITVTKQKYRGFEKSFYQINEIKNSKGN